MNKKLKISIGIVYLICLLALLYTIFSFLDLRDLTDYSFIRNNSQILIELKNKQLLFFITLFFIFLIIWTLLLGFASPVAILSGFIFGSTIGTIISIIGLSVGCTFLYIFAKIYFKDFIIDYFEKKIIKFKLLFKKNEFLYYLVFRLCGGAGIPFPLQNILPVIIDMKIKNYFFSTLIGLTPGLFILCSIGSGLEKIIEKNENFGFKEAIYDPAIYWPLFGFIFILITSFIIKKKFFRN